MAIICMIMTYVNSESVDQPGKVANPARGQLNKERNIPLSPYAPGYVGVQNNVGFLPELLRLRCVQVSLTGLPLPIGIKVRQMAIKCELMSGRREP